MSERRTEKRIPLQFPVRFGVENAFSKGNTMDISMTGIRIASSTTLPPGTKTRINIEIEAGGEKQIKVRGRVRWVSVPNPEDPKDDIFQMGVKLNWRDERYFDFLADLIEERRPQEKDEEIEIEQRSEERYDKKVRVIFDDVEEAQYQITKNVSKGGLFVITERPLPKGTYVRLRLVLPQIMDDVYVRGQVVFSFSLAMAQKLMRPPGIGVKLVEFDEGDHEKFMDFIAMLMPQSNEASP